MNHSSYSDALIRDIFAKVRTIAVLGASPYSARPSHGVTAFLVRQGYEVFAVNPGHAGKTIAGAPTFATLADVPVAIDMVDVFRASDNLPEIVNEVLALEPLPKVLWTQLGVRDDEAASRAQAAGITVIQNRCPAIEMPRLSLTA